MSRQTNANIIGQKFLIEKAPVWMNALGLWNIDHMPKARHRVDMHNPTLMYGDASQSSCFPYWTTKIDVNMKTLHTTNPSQSMPASGAFSFGRNGRMNARINIAADSVRIIAVLWT